MSTPLTDADAFMMADAFQQLVATRTGIPRDMLICPREKSYMTPCIARDGSLAVCSDSYGGWLCVGCEASVVRLTDEERERGTSPTTPPSNQTGGTST